MIDFRYHLVSIVAVFLALAIGIVLGSTELQGHTLDVLQSTSDSLRNQLAAASAERDTYQSQAGAADQFLQTAASTLLQSRLSGQKVVLITEPGAASGAISGVRGAAGTAGATVTGEIELQPKFYDLAGAPQSALGTINTSVANDVNVTLAPGGDPRTANQQQAAQLIAAAVLAKTDNSNKHGSAGGGSSAGAGSGPITPAKAQTLLAAYAQQGYLTTAGAPAQRATLAVIIVPAAPPPGGENDPLNQVLLAVAPQFASASAATVVGGSAEGSAQEGSSISVLRSSSAAAQMSTVDNADTTLGQISVVEALASQLAGGKPNSYGISGASSVSPDPLPSPIATPTPARPKKSGKANK